MRQPPNAAVLTPAELVHEYAKAPAWAARQLAGGAVEEALARGGRADLARVAAESRRAGADPIEALHLFIEFARIREYVNRTPGRRLNILLLGRTGVGKSSLTNTVAGAKVAAVGAFEAVTDVVTAYDLEINGVPCTIIDTPGLCDGKDRNDTYLLAIRSRAGTAGIDCVWYVTPLPDTRVRTDEIEALRTISWGFGPHIWQRSLIALTFADQLSEPDDFAAVASVRVGPVRAAIAEAVSTTSAVRGQVAADLAAGIPFVPMTNRAAATPDGRRWLGALLLAALHRMAPEGVEPFGADGPPAGGNRFRCAVVDGDGPPEYTFICRSVGRAGSCHFCGRRFSV